MKKLVYIGGINLICFAGLASGELVHWTELTDREELYDASRMSTLVVDISGMESWGFQGDPNNGTLSVFGGRNATLTNIRWDVNLTTHGISWAEEVHIGFFDNREVVQIAPGDSTTVTNMNYTGSEGTTIVLGIDGILDFEVYEVDWDDNADAPDAVFEEGSLLYLSFPPAPGPLAAFGVAGLLAGRRRRS